MLRMRDLSIERRLDLYRRVMGLKGEGLNAAQIPHMSNRSLLKYFPKRTIHQLKNKANWMNLGKKHSRPRNSAGRFVSSPI